MTSSFHVVAALVLPLTAKIFPLAKETTSFRPRDETKSLPCLPTNAVLPWRVACLTTRPQKKPVFTKWSAEKDYVLPVAVLPVRLLLAPLSCRARRPQWPNFSGQVDQVSALAVRPALAAPVVPLFFAFLSVPGTGLAWPPDQLVTPAQPTCNSMSGLFLGSQSTE